MNYGGRRSTLRAEIKRVNGLSANAGYPRLRENKPRKRSGKIRVALFLLFVILLVILFFKSSISKIDSIRITGNHYAPTVDIGQAMGIFEGDLFFKTSADTIEKRIVSALPVVKSAEVRKHFPGRVVVNIEEFPDVAFEIGGDGRQSIVLANGVTLPLDDKNVVISKPILTGWAAYGDLKKELCLQLSSIEGSMLTDISEIQAIPSDSYPDKIKMYTRSRFEVITTVSFLPAKIPLMRAIVSEKEPGYITLLDADTYAPFEKSSESKKDRPQDY